MTRGNKILTIAAFALMTSLCVLAQSRWTQMPASFKHTQKNSLIGAQYLDSALIKAADSTGIKIVHIGDSHVKGKYFPQSLEATLLGTLPRLNMTFYGINGALNSGAHLVHHLNADQEEAVGFGRAGFGPGFHQEMIRFGR